MNDREALYRTICERPEDDTPRLVYADWLQEHGDEARAEFIRVQCRLNAMDWDDPEHVDLKIEEECLLGRYGEEWLQDVRSWGDDIEWRTKLYVPERPGFERGFPAWPEVIPESVAQVRGLLERLIQETPSRGIDFEQVENLAPELLRIPALSQFPNLALWTMEEGNGYVDEIARSALFENLRKLYLMMDLNGTSLDALGSSSSLGQLRELNLNVPPLPTVDLRRFLRSPTAVGLRFLARAEDEISTKELIAIAEAELPQLRALEWDTGDPIGVALRKLLENDSLSHLSSLKLLNLGITADDIPGAKVRSPVTLKRLQLQHVDVDADLVRALIHSQACRELQWLHIDSSNFNDEALGVLLSWDRLRELHRLELRTKLLTFRGLEEVVNRPYPHLRCFFLSQLTEGLSRDPKPRVPMSRIEMPAARFIHLEGLPIGDRGARELAENGSLARLRVLELPDSQIGDEGAIALVESPHLRHVERLQLSSNLISHPVRLPLAERPGVIL